MLFVLVDRCSDEKETVDSKLSQNPQIGDFLGPWLPATVANPLTSPKSNPKPAQLPWHLPLLSSSVLKLLGSGYLAMLMRWKEGKTGDPLVDANMQVGCQLALCPTIMEADDRGFWTPKRNIVFQKSIRQLP